MTEESCWLEAILRRKSYEESPIKLVDVKSSNVVGKGENYMSTISRVKVRVILGSGKHKQISLIVKSQHSTENMKKISLDLGVFFKEIVMYRDILPMAEHLLEEVDDTDGIFWGRCYDYRLYDRIVFEDLATTGYKMLSRQKQLGLDAALLVIRHLAKFHALSKVILDRGDIPMDVFGTHFWRKNPTFSNVFAYENFRKLIDMMKTWGDEWIEPLERYTSALPGFTQKLMDALEVKPDDFNVLNHGDCWTNNILFQYGDDPEHPTSMKFIDWQISTVQTPARDLHYFLTSSVRQEVQEDPTQFDKILQTYCNVLKNWLSKLQYEGFIPEIENIKDMLKEKAIFSLETCTGLLPIVLGDMENAPDIEEMMATVTKGMESLEASESVKDAFSEMNKHYVIGGRSELCVLGDIENAPAMEEMDSLFYSITSHASTTNLNDK